MSGRDKMCCADGSCCTVKLDHFSRQVASRLTGKALQEKVTRESKIFSNNRANDEKNK